MPTTDPGRGLTPTRARALVDEHAFTGVGEGDQRGVGIEVEVLPVLRAADRDALHRWQRLPLSDAADRLDDLARRSARVGDRMHRGQLSVWPAGSGHLSFEPGGQLEYSGGVAPAAAGALADADAVMLDLASAWQAADQLLLSAGIDVWTDLDEVPQQLEAGRYVAMDAYFAKRGVAGRRMMRHTCALQVNLDPGAGEEAEARWLLANLSAPITTATFACSPAADPDPAVSLRARSWRHLDPSRTGIPGPRDLAAAPDRRADWFDFAMAADVLLVETADGTTHPGRPGFSFGHWLRDGDPELGWPTAEDLRHHLTTLFPEVRPRGAIELRSVDALPARWRAVPVVLTTGLLYDPTAQRQALDVLTSRGDRLRDDLVRAGEVGLKDAELCAVAVEVWSFALEGARRLGPSYHRATDLDTAEAFLDQLTMRGRCPADELRERRRDDLDEAAAWAAEPTPQVVDVR